MNGGINIKETDIFSGIDMEGMIEILTSQPYSSYNKKKTEAKILKATEILRR